MPFESIEPRSNKLNTIKIYSSRLILIFRQILDKSQSQKYCFIKKNDDESGSNWIELVYKHVLWSLYDKKGSQDSSTRNAKRNNNTYSLTFISTFLLIGKGLHFCWLVKGFRFKMKVQFSFPRFAFPFRPFHSLRIKHKRKKKKKRNDYWSENRRKLIQESYMYICMAMASWLYNLINFSRAQKWIEGGYYQLVEGGNASYHGLAFE